MDALYDQTGVVCACLHEGGHIYDLSGQNLALIDGDSVYDLSGNHIG